ncbi:MAG: putative ubiquitin-RnfH superfamily antitoxin RatB of RatAB toxin-antitoxin module [Arenicella sp.]|jgi:putative ubiquitin-RnfH superfamily antitoxin RatB of RatAB toxin-antitoxin module
MRFKIAQSSYTAPQHQLIKPCPGDRSFMHTINVSLVYATEKKQWLYEAPVGRGTSAQELIQDSGFMVEIEALFERQLETLDIGVFSQKVAHDYLLQDGDRLEIYRPLTADPKEVRRQLALMGKTIGKGRI